MSGFRILISLQIQAADLVDKNFSYNFCHIHILPISIIGGAIFVWILQAPSKEQNRQILYMTKNGANVAQYNVHYLKSRL